MMISQIQNIKFNNDYINVNHFPFVIINNLLCTTSLLSHSINTINLHNAVHFTWFNTFKNVFFFNDIINNVLFNASLLSHSINTINVYSAVHFISIIIFKHVFFLMTYQYIIILHFYMDLKLFIALNKFQKSSLQ